jgi:phosphate starvation-inducible PhoH-like protein
VVVTGDQTQKDLPVGVTSGLDQALTVLKDVEDIGFSFLDNKDVVRHPLVQQIVTAYDAYEKKQARRDARRKEQGGKHGKEK